MGLCRRGPGSMKRRRHWIATTAGLVALASVVAPSVAIAATLKADYQFQDTLASSVAAAPDLFDGGPGKAFDTEHVGSCPAARVLTFPADNGFSLPRGSCRTAVIRS